MGTEGRGFDPLHPDILLEFSSMEIIELTEAEAQDQLEDMLDACETGQVYTIVMEDGRKVMMVPADPSKIGIPEDDYSFLYDHDDAT